MIETANVIVSFLLLPVMLFVIIPLTMLSAYLLFKLTLPLWTKRDKVDVKKQESEEVGSLTKA